MASVNQRIDFSRDIDVFGVGNALVDTVAFVEDKFVSGVGLKKGIMTLAESDVQGDLLIALEEHQLELRSGGSAANTVWAVSICGGSGVFTGKVAADPNGAFFQKELRGRGLHFDVEMMPENRGSTGTCVILTTPDAQRTMSTHLGCSVQLSASDIDPGRIRDCKLAYLEGYLWMGESTRAAMIKTAEEARKADTPVALTFSDPDLVAGVKDDFRKFADEYCDIVFANADEVRSFSDKEELEDCIKDLGSVVPLAFVTNNKDGSYVIADKKLSQVHGFPVKAVDSNGAGDSFAGAVLFAMSRGYTNDESARWGNYLGAEVVRVHGPRLHTEYAEHVKEILG